MIKEKKMVSNLNIGYFRQLIKIQNIGYKVFISPLKQICMGNLFLFPKNLNAKSVNYKFLPNNPKKIYFNMGWISCMMVYGKEYESLKKAFLQTLWHEVGHCNGDFKDYFSDYGYGKDNLSDNEMKLIDWCMEIHHDIFSIKMTGYNNNDIEEIIRYKIYISDILGDTSDEYNDTTTHPSLSFRKQCMCEYSSFTERLIVTVSNKINNTIEWNRKLFTDMVKFYDERETEYRNHIRIIDRQ